MLEKFDRPILQFCALFSHKSEVFDRFFVNMLARPSYKTLPLFAILWFLWFREKDREQARQYTLLAAIAGTMSFITSRTIQNFVSERPRPMHTPAMADVYKAPYGVNKDMLENWSSFPSDHAALVYGLSSALFIYNRWVGLLAFFWSTVVVCAPRVYAGYHYASDILAGLIVGMGVCAVLRMTALPAIGHLVRGLEQFEAKYKGAFYALAFMVAFEFVIMFNDVREPLRTLAEHMGF